MSLSRTRGRLLFFIHFYQKEGDHVEGLEEKADPMRDTGKGSTENHRLLFQKKKDNGTDCVHQNDGGGIRTMNMNMPNMQEALRMLQNDPRSFLQQAGMNVPEELMNNPQAIVKHLINTNQVGGQMLQRIMPMIQSMGGIK